jgi:hypothetical protein
MNDLDIILSTVEIHEFCRYMAPSLTRYGAGSRSFGRMP